MSAKDTGWREEDLELLRLISLGFGNKQIAVRLHVSETAIKKRIGNLLRRAEAKNRAGLVRVAFTSGATSSGSIRTGTRTTGSAVRR